MLIEGIGGNQEHNNVSFTDLFYGSTALIISYKGKNVRRDTICRGRLQIHHFNVWATHARFVLK